MFSLPYHCFMTVVTVDLLLASSSACVRAAIRSCFASPPTASNIVVPYKFNESEAEPRLYVYVILKPSGIRVRRSRACDRFTKIVTDDRDLAASGGGGGAGGGSSVLVTDVPASSQDTFSTFDDSGSNAELPAVSFELTPTQEGKITPTLHVFVRFVELVSIREHEGHIFSPAKMVRVVETLPQEHVIHRVEK